MSAKAGTTETSLEPQQDSLPADLITLHARPRTSLCLCVCEVVGSCV